MFDFLDPNTAAKVLAVLGLLSGVRMLLDAFGNKDNPISIWLGKAVDFFSANVKH